MEAELLARFMTSLVQGAHLSRLSEEGHELVQAVCQTLKIKVNKQQDECGHPFDFYRTLCGQKHCLACLKQRLDFGTSKTCLCGSKLSPKNLLEIEGKELVKGQPLVPAYFGICRHELKVEDKIRCTCRGPLCLKCRLTNLTSMSCYKCSTTYTSDDSTWLVEQCEKWYSEWLARCGKCREKKLINTPEQEPFCINCDELSSVYVGDSQTPSTSS